MTAPAPMDVTAIYELPVPIWVTGTVLGETYPSGFGKLRFEVVMPQSQSSVGGAPAIDGVTIPTESPDGELLAWTTKYAATISPSFEPATALRRIAITAVEAPTQAHRTWASPDHQLAEQAVFWFDRVRTWVEILTGQDLDPNHRVFDAEAIGAGLTFIEPPHQGELGSRFRVPFKRPVSADQWQMILAAVRDGEDPPLEHVLLRDARAALTRLFHRRVIIDAAAAVEIVLARIVVGRAKEVPESQRNRLTDRTTLGAYVNIAKTSGFEFDVTFKDLEQLSKSRNDAIHRGQAPDDSKTHRLLGIATDFVRAHGPLERVSERGPETSERIVDA